MKTIFYILIILITTLFYSCSDKVTDADLEKFLNSQYIKDTKEFDISKTYPFSEAKAIEILSYPNRIMWDTIANNKDNYGAYINHTIIKNGNINFDLSKIKETIKLTTKQKDALFNLTFNSKCELPLSAACYDPRHCIVFYDKDNNAFAYIEICLSCLSTRESKNIIIGGFCDEKIADFKTMFKAFGLKYGLNGEDN